MASWPRVLAPPAAAFGAVMVAGDFDIEGWQRVAQFAAALGAAILGWWTLLAKVWAPYKVKRDRAKADALAKIEKEKAEAARVLREEYQQMVRKEIEAAGLNRICVELVELRKQFLEVFKEYDHDIADLLMILTDRAMTSNDAMRVLYHVLKVEQPPLVEDEHTNWKVLSKGIRERLSARHKRWHDEHPHPERTTPPIPGGRRKADPPGPRGSDI